MHGYKKRVFCVLIAMCILGVSCIFLIPGGLFPTSKPTTSRAAGKHGLQTEKVGGLLFVNPDNRRYFTDGTMMNGKYRVTYLTGSHTWCDFMDCGSSTPISDAAVFDYTAYLDFLAANNHNFIRLWRAENSRGGEAGEDFWFSPSPINVQQPLVVPLIAGISSI
jgi:major membrane immunogen (membrane-anchored lipoprotein)